VGQIDKFFCSDDTIDPFKVGFRSDRCRRNNEANRNEDQHRGTTMSSSSHSSAPFFSLGEEQPSAGGLPVELG
jgi:hypothetical protein